MGENNSFIISRANLKFELITSAQSLFPAARILNSKDFKMWTYNFCTDYSTVPFSCSKGYLNTFKQYSNTLASSYTSWPNTKLCTLGSHLVYHISRDTRSCGRNILTLKVCIINWEFPWIHIAGSWGNCLELFIFLK